MTSEKDLKPKKPKRENTKFIVVSNAKEILTTFFENSNYEQYPDMYEDIADYCGVAPSTIAQLRLKGVAPGYIVGIRLAEFVGVEPTDIWKIIEREDVLVKDKCKIPNCHRTSANHGLCLSHTYLHHKGLGY